MTHAAIKKRLQKANQKALPTWEEIIAVMVKVAGRPNDAHSLYRHHLGLLGLPGDWLPEGVSHETKRPFEAARK